MAIGTLVVCVPLLAAGDQVRVVPESDLKSWWQLDAAWPNHPPRYTVEALKADVEGCMAVAFEIHGDGSVSNERIWLDKVPRFSYRKDMERSVLLAVHQWRYIPADANAHRDPVYTYQIVTFTLTGSSPAWTKYDQEQHDKLQAGCEMSHFLQQVQAMLSARAPASNKS